MRYWSSRLRETRKSYAGRNGYRWAWCIMLIWNWWGDKINNTKHASQRLFCEMERYDCCIFISIQISDHSTSSHLLWIKLNWDLFGRVELHCFFNPVIHRLNFSWASMLRAMTVITQIGHVHAVTWPHHKTSRIDVQSPQCLRLRVHISSYGGKICAHRIKCSLVSRSVQTSSPLDVEDAVPLLTPKPGSDEKSWRYETEEKGDHVKNIFRFLLLASLSLFLVRLCSTSSSISTHGVITYLKL